MTTVATPRSAMEQIASGALTSAKGSAQLGLLTAGYGIGVLRRQAARARHLEPDYVEIVEIVHKPGPVHRLAGATLRLGIGIATIGAIVAVIAIATKFSRSKLPEPAAAPPTVRPMPTDDGPRVRTSEADESRGKA